MRHFSGIKIILLLSVLYMYIVFWNYFSFLFKPCWWCSVSILALHSEMTPGVVQGTKGGAWDSKYDKQDARQTSDHCSVSSPSSDRSSSTILQTLEYIFSWNIKIILFFDIYLYLNIYIPLISIFKSIYVFVAIALSVLIVFQFL